MTKHIVLAFTIIASLTFAGCSQNNNPTAPAPPDVEENTFSSQVMVPEDILYKAQCGHVIGQKPYYWFDAVDTPAFNATILTDDNGQSANITRVTSGTWGKVRTFAINASTDYNSIRVFVPSHTTSCTWKIVIQEEGGAWRNWILQNSTGFTGYKDYDFSTINAAILAGSGVFTIEIIVEGAVGQSIELAELYVFNENGNVAPFEEYYWKEIFSINPFEYPNAHTTGWFDSTTNPEFKCTIINLGAQTGRITPEASAPPEGGKIISPVILWNSNRCNTITIKMTNPHLHDVFTIVIQEQTGSYRRFIMDKTLFHDTYPPAPTYYGGYTVDLSTITTLTDGTPFSIAIEGITDEFDIYSFYLN